MNDYQSSRIRRHGRRHERRLRIEHLEDRRLLAIVTVDNDSDSANGNTSSIAALIADNGGDGISLREAITAANNTPNGILADEIQFSIGSGIATIRPSAALPLITDSVRILAFTQPGYAGLPLIELDGSSAGANANGLMLATGGSNGSTIRDLVINRFSGDGIFIQLSDSNIIAGNFIGTDVSGMLDMGNGRGGVFLSGSSSNTIGGTTPADRNVISGNGFEGIFVFGGNGNVIQGNYIGTSADGENDLGNSFDGIVIQEASSNTVGGTTSAARNVISGNGTNGVTVSGGAAVNNVIASNYIGSNASGEVDIANGVAGVLVTRTSTGSAASNTTIGGTTPGAGNVISGNTRNGIELFGGSNATTIQGNFIGVSADGLSPLPNGGDGSDPFGGSGIDITDSTNNFVGGDDDDDGVLDGNVAARNVISANVKNGILLDGTQGFTATGNTIAGNIIGLGSDGMQELGNEENGILIKGAANNTIGGTAAGAENTISGNSNNGVRIDNGAAGTVLLGNRIGTDLSGTDARGNLWSGVHIEASSGNRIGGVDADEGNIVAGNGIHGVTIEGAAANNNEIVGNFIGTNSDGSASLGNASSGVFINESPSNFIGVTSPANGSLRRANVISGNMEHGVEVFSEEAAGNVIRANLIGTMPDGIGELGNAMHGIRVLIANETQIGGANAGDGNVIAFNGSALGLQGHGVLIEFGRQNSIRGNSIHSNAGRGIDLDNDSFTINDRGDGDSGANDLQNYPVATAVAFLGPIKTISWTLTGMANSTYTLDFYANNAPDPSGFGEGQTYLGSTDVTTFDLGDNFGRVSTGPILFNASDQFISATATDSMGNTSEFSLVDTDGDALADAWESTGIDFNEDGVIDLTLSSDPNHKDIFVEVDAMTGRAPDPGALTDVIAAFAAAPAVLVQNPDGNDGVTLHAPLDETNIPLAAFPNGLIDSVAVKMNHFGTPAERNDPNASNILAAKRLVYHWALFADTTGDSSIRGVGERLGNDFVVTLGLWKTPEGTPGGTRDQQAGIFMHELGHNLNLGHGGEVLNDFNYKPNYHSVMNYIWSTPGKLPDTRLPTANEIAFHNSWVLDYSRTPFPDLNENDLDEMAGIGGHSGHTVRLNSGLYVSENGPVDWNQMNGNMETGVMADINGDGSMTTLTGYSDWPNLEYYFVEAFFFTENAAPGDEIEEPTFELWSSMIDWRALPGDYNTSGTVDAADYVVWRKTLGQEALLPYAGADGDGNSIVESADHTVWAANFGSSIGAGAAAAVDADSQDQATPTSTQLQAFAPTKPAASSSPDEVSRTLTQSVKSTDAAFAALGRFAPTAGPRSLIDEGVFSRIKPAASLVSHRTADLLLAARFADGPTTERATDQLGNEKRPDESDHQILPDDVTSLALAELFNKLTSLSI